MTSLLQTYPRIPAPLDPHFIPAVLANRNYRQAVAASSNAVTLAIALERENGQISRSDVQIFAPGSPYDADSRKFVERHIKFLLWARGGWKLYLSGPDFVCRDLQARYAADGARAFDANLMRRVYEQPFTVAITDMAQMPATHEVGASVGGHLDGCRIGFDLGASDYKLAAVVDGEPIFSTEIRWDPVGQADPQYHYARIAEGLRQVATYLPRVDAIGGSSAGIFVANQPKIASLFRAVPEADFDRVIKPLFLNVQKAWGVPLVVINDGDVTALAGALTLKKNAILGVAMGSSEAVGYLNPAGRITGYLNELAFAPVDFAAQAAKDEWSQDIGVGALYFSQQAVNKLAPAAGFTFPADMLLPERLKIVQTKANDNDPAAAQIFETIGVYLGYTLPHYADYYDYANLLLLGRVTSGRGGEILLKSAQRVLTQEFPDVAARIALHVPDETSRRVGQAVAAASLPEIN